MAAAWLSSNQRALERALKAGVQVERAESQDGEPLSRWTVDSASTYGKSYQVRIIDGMFTCTCQGAAHAMCLHRAAVMGSLGTLSLDPPRCRRCRHRHKPAKCERWCPECKTATEVKLLDDAPASRPADEYVRLFGE